MTRLQMLVPALVIAALLTAAPAAPAATGSAANIDVKLDLPANHGFDADIEIRDGIMLEIERKGRSVTYEVPGEVTDAGLKAQFGKLGLIDVAFTPIETRTFKPPKGCKGEPSTFSEGLFIGTIRFRGERNYVRIEATQAEGTMEIPRGSEWRCSRGDKPVRPPISQPEAKREQGILIVRKRGCVCFFAAVTGTHLNGNEWVAFGGVKFEEREKMRITRGLSVMARPGRFVFDHDDGSARVDPPRPFTGTATYARRPGRDRWRSTIRVPLLGAPPLQIRPNNSSARLVREPSAALKPL
jgi:hypothetical protein